MSEMSPTNERSSEEDFDSMSYEWCGTFNPEAQQLVADRAVQANPNWRSFGVEVHQLRMDGKITIGDMARSLEIGVAEYSDLEQGHREPGPDEFIERLALVLDTDAELLIQKAATARDVGTAIE